MTITIVPTMYSDLSHNKASFGLSDIRMELVKLHIFFKFTHFLLEIPTQYNQIMNIICLEKCIKVLIIFKHHLVLKI